MQQRKQKQIRAPENQKRARKMSFFFFLYSKQIQLAKAGKLLESTEKYAQYAKATTKERKKET